jgi:hypothetical protein
MPIAHGDSKLLVNGPFSAQIGVTGALRRCQNCRQERQLLLY